ncbi:MAG: NAD-dependent epimerase/dehydratase family protein [Halioglobus sp.]|nr:NAD-dependent epimerase/dehydratase family protein [Halioglobus sp.]
MKCLVTGATGFIGRRLCPELSAGGHDVTPLSLHGGALADGSPSIALDLAQDVPGDVFDGVDVVFHLAGIAHQQAEPGQYEALNHLGTLRLAQAALAAGVKHFIFLSSVKAMGSADSGAPRAETDCNLPGDAYGLSKWRAECALRELCRDTAMALTVLRPALVYGAGVKGNLDLLARGIRWGLPRPPQGGKRSMIALDDLVGLLVHLVTEPPGGQHTWIAAAESYTAREVYDALRSAAGRGPGRAWAPRWAWRGAAFVFDRLRGADGTWDKLFGAELYDNAALLADTGWRPGSHLRDSAPAMVRGRAVP